MTMAIEMLYFAPTVTALVYQVCWILFAQDSQRRVEFVLFDVAVRGEILARGTPRDEILSGKKRQRPCIIVVLKMNLRPPKGIRVTV